MAKGGKSGGGKMPTPGKLVPLKTTQPKTTLRKDNSKGVPGKTK